MSSSSSTIVAISTSPGIGGIGIIRMSGKDCFKILDKVFKQKNHKDIDDIKGYSLKYGYIMDKDEIIDEVLVSYFKTPNSYTTENMCEINSHGGIVVMNKILDLCIKKGASLAEPGEFTKRAFLGGRIDLSQAEAVIDIINAKTDKEAKMSVSQLEGALSEKINEIRHIILNMMADIEAAIDYPEYDIEDVTSSQMLDMLDLVDKKITLLENSFDNGKILRDGIKTAIIGRPNAGKSSLLNIILNEERAIVTEIEGTTRDSIEEYIQIKGIPVKIIDTAGIRNSDNIVEKIGINKAIEIAKNSDLIVAIFDISKKLEEDDDLILDLISNRPAIIILNKTDLKVNNIELNKIKMLNKPIVEMSTKTREGLDKLYDEIAKMFKLEEIGNDGELIVSNMRHKEVIIRAKEDIKEAKATIMNNLPIDIISSYLREILEDLGKITGETVTEDIINEIFSKFCLGK